MALVDCFIVQRLFLPLYLEFVGYWFLFWWQFSYKPPLISNPGKYTYNVTRDARYYRTHYQNRPIMALNVISESVPIGKMMPICLADKRNTLTHTTGAAARGGAKGVEAPNVFSKAPEMFLLPCLVSTITEFPCAIKYYYYNRRFVLCTYNCVNFTLSFIHSR